MLVLSARLASLSPWQARQSSLAGGFGASCSGPAAIAPPPVSTTTATASAARSRIRIDGYDRRVLLLQRRQVRHERVDIVLGQRVLLHLRLARGLGLRGHALGVGDPLADFVRAQLAADA